MIASPFTEPQKRSRRRKCGSWNPLVDLHEIYAGHRSTDRRGVFDLFDAPVGVALRVEPAAGFSFAECDRLMGDESDRAVTWNGNSDISSIGESVSIRVKMFQAKLFAYNV